MLTQVPIWCALICPFFKCPLQEIIFTLLHCLECPAIFRYNVSYFLRNQKTRICIGIRFFACGPIFELGVQSRREQEQVTESVHSAFVRVSSP